MVVTINFRNIYNRKDELNSFLTEDNIDIVLGSERHLSPSTNNAEILSWMYTSYRLDRGNDWGGIIIITKKKLTVEEIKIKRVQNGSDQGGNLSEVCNICIFLKPS